MAQATITLNGVTLTGAGVPVAAADPRIITGAVLLVDTSNPASDPVDLGTQNGATVTNLAAATCQALTGSDGALATYSTATLTQAKIAATPAGSLHFTSSITNDVASGQVGLTYDGNVRFWLNANKTHSFYLGVQYVLTREVVPSGMAQWPVAGVMGTGAWASSNVHAVGRTPALADAGYPGSTDPRRGGFSTDDIANGTYTERHTGITATDYSILTGTAGQFIIATGPSGTSSWLHHTPSVVLRSLWLLDLTAAGMTHAQAWAVDQAAHRAGVGSRWASESLPAALA